MGFGITDVIRFTISTSGPQTTLDGKITIEDGAWTHVAATYDRNKMRIYVNGLEDTNVSSTNAIQINARVLAIGRYDALSDAYFNGTMDEIAIWNVSLDNTSIMQHALRGYVNLSLQARTCSQAGCADNPSFQGPNGIGGYFTNMSEIKYLNFNSGRYFQYIAYLSTNSTNLTPMLQEVNVSFIGFPLSPTLSSFIVQNSTGSTVAYLNSTGNLLLLGTLTDQVLFE